MSKNGRIVPRLSLAFVVAIGAGAAGYGCSAGRSEGQGAPRDAGLDAEPIDASAAVDGDAAAGEVATDAASAEVGADAGADGDAAGEAGDDAGAGPCVDVCVHGDVDAGKVCSLWQPSTGTWETIQDGAGFLENRARRYTTWLRRDMEPAGGVMSAFYADAGLTNVIQYGNTRDSAIWTGTYLAAEALRYLSDGHPEALDHVRKQVAVLHRWFNISGDPGYLARYVAPAGSPAPVQLVFDAANDENHRGWSFEGQSWHWKGHTSRDQYQGPMLGYSLAYEAATDEATREPIRYDVVRLVEQLMKVERHDAKVVITGLPIPVTIGSVSLDFQYSVFAASESASTHPEIQVDYNHPGQATLAGFQEFYPDLKPLLSQVSALSSLPSVPRASSAIMLSSFFLVALQVTEGVPAYAARRATIKAFYESHVNAWLDVAATWSYGDNTSGCGAKYYGTHISFEPMYDLARLEYDATRRERIRRDVLGTRMWLNGVANHKNVFFAYVHAANPPLGKDVTAVVEAHSAQLLQFPPAPLVPRAFDLTGKYPADPACPGLSSEAVDVGERALKDYMWQHAPWDLQGAAVPDHALPGVDYLLAYWQGRRHGFLKKDATVQCLRWK